MSKFHCEYNDEYVDLNYCKNECGNDECDIYEEQERIQNNSEVIQNSELKEKALKTLSSLVGCEKEKINGIVDRMFKDIALVTEREIKRSIEELIKAKIENKVKEKVNDEIESIFEEVLSREILKIDGKNISVVKLQEDMEKKVINFLNNGYDRRKTLDDSIDKCIGKIAENKVNDVLKEIKEQAIDKFNKEMMKKMMQGMAGAISDDKRLLSLLEG